MGKIARVVSFDRVTSEKVMVIQVKSPFGHTRGSSDVISVLTWIPSGVKKGRWERGVRVGLPIDLRYLKSSSRAWKASLLTTS